MGVYAHANVVVSNSFSIDRAKGAAISCFIRSRSWADWFRSHRCFCMVEMLLRSGGVGLSVNSSCVKHWTVS